METEYGATIKSSRESAGMTQQTLFEKLLKIGLSWSQSTLSKVESGTRPLRFGEGVAVAQALGISLEELAGVSSPSSDLAGIVRSHELDVMEQFIAARRIALLPDSIESHLQDSKRESR